MTGPNREAIEELFDALQFNTLRKRLFDLFGEDPEEAAEEAAIPAHEHARATPPALAAWFGAHGAQLLGLHAATVSAGGGSDAVGLAFASNDATAFVSLEEIDEPTPSRRWPRCCPRRATPRRCTTSRAPTSCCATAGWSWPGLWMTP